MNEPPSWFFYKGAPSAPRYGGDPTKHAVDRNTKTFVREVLQNSNDQGLDNDYPVEVRFEFTVLSGDELRTFEEAARWDDLVPHLEAVAERDRGRGYEQFLEQWKEEDELLLLTIEDRNTTGLTGTWEEEDSNFNSLVRDELFSSKQSDTAGGSYGLGKSVLWTFSGASTVVFNSVLSEPDPREDSPRLIGRTKLPYHESNVDSSKYHGAGWLCRVDKTDEGLRPKAIWGDEVGPLAEALQVERPDVSGTSVTVVGFRDPTRDVRPDVETLADEFVETAVTYFWPALYRGDLEVYVETPSEVQKAEIEDVPEVEPFVESYSRRFDANEKLEKPGDVASRRLSLSIPERRDGETALEGSASLSVRLAAPTDADEYRNRVAMFRGPGMVVKYLDQSRVAFGDRNFFATLSCGEARTSGAPTAEDEAVDRFLRFAEPPTHDDWVSTEKLREQYKRGYRMAIDDLMAELREGLRDLVSRHVGEGGRLPDTILEAFPIYGTEVERSSSRGRSTFDIEGSSEYEGDRWAFHGRVESKVDHNGWTATVSLSRVGEDGSVYDEIPIENLGADEDGVRCSTQNGVGRVEADSDVEKVTFRGQSRRIDGSVRDVVGGRVGATRLDIETELRRATEER